MLTQYQSVDPTLGKYQSVVSGPINPYNPLQASEDAISNDSFNERYNQTILWPNRSANASKYRNYLKNIKAQNISETADKLDYEWTLQDIGNYIRYAKQDYIGSIAKTDNNLATALQQANESYWANLLWSWIQAYRTAKIVEKWQQAKDLANVQKNQTIDQYNDKREQAKAKYEQVIQPTNEMQRQEIKYNPTSPIGKRTAWNLVRASIS